MSSIARSGPGYNASIAAINAIALKPMTRPTPSWRERRRPSGKRKTSGGIHMPIATLPQEKIHPATSADGRPRALSVP